MTLEQIEKAIYDEYRRFHEYDPAIRPKEAGWLGQLWRAWDHAVAQRGGIDYV